MIKYNCFIELPDFQKTVYWLGRPFIVESSFRGRFLSVRDIDDNNLEYVDSCLYEDIILRKFEILTRLKLL